MLWVCSKCIGSCLLWAAKRPAECTDPNTREYMNIKPEWHVCGPLNGYNAIKECLQFHGYEILTKEESQRVICPKHRKEECPGK